MKEKNRLHPSQGKGKTMKIQEEVSEQVKLGEVFLEDIGF